MTPIDRLRDIMAALRDPDGGCPWDLEQDFDTIAPYTIEEAYEVADAIADGDMNNLRDELGDLLFQVVFHARMAEERGAFDFDAVATAISDKMERRHPHVFGGAQLRSAAEQSLAWEAHKRAERADGGRPPSALDAVRGGRPALQRALELQRAAAGCRFDWPSADGVVRKLQEEMGELERALDGGDGDPAEELGDVIFTCINLARHLGADPESTLRRANAKFEERFRAMESRIASRGQRLEDLSAEEMDASWEAAKRSPGG